MLKWMTRIRLDKNINLTWHDLKTVEDCWVIQIVRKKFRQLDGQNQKNVDALRDIEDPLQKGAE